MDHPRIVGLHGFGGSGRSWDAVRDELARQGGDPDRLITPDLRGHGAAFARRPVDIDHVLEDVAAVVREAAADGPVVLAGYSLGGRVAVQLALRDPAPLAELTLISSTSGLDDPAERTARRSADERLAQRLEADGVERFAARWGELPLWDGDPPAARAAQRAELEAGDAAGLAAALRGLSPGAVPAVGDRLATLAVPLRVVVGSRDRRYRAVAARLVALAPQTAGEVVVADAGHGLLREAPAAVATALLALHR
jgi:2-succinyl-6-hydroxy-2,4-cyclohexadiene-1-carboxylate synthase